VIQSGGTWHTSRQIKLVWVSCHWRAIHTMQWHSLPILERYVTLNTQDVTWLPAYGAPEIGSIFTLMCDRICQQQTRPFELLWKRVVQNGLLQYLITCVGVSSCRLTMTHQGLGWITKTLCTHNEDNAFSIWKLSSRNQCILEKPRYFTILYHALFWCLM
jgi:hypothetical protein